jgi:hypothetical protein
MLHVQGAANASAVQGRFGVLCIAIGAAVSTSTTLAALPDLA